MAEPLVESVVDFASWRKSARAHLVRATPPSSVIWRDAGEGQSSLFGASHTPEVIPRRPALSLPRAFLELAATVARHVDAGRWALLYRVAWRILYENRQLLEMESDDDVRTLGLMAKAVGRDVHKMRAFVRFREVVDECGEQFVAWYRPEHHILEVNERFFVDRFGGMRWAILTPRASLIWDLEQVRYGPGVPRSEAPAEDEFEDLWRSYYRSIFNPARVNLAAMRAQMPVYRWEDLPESRAIAELVRESPARVRSMIESPARAVSRLANEATDLASLYQAVRRCAACELCGRATQPVVGEGPARAAVMLVGEQPGDEEDRAGRPFAGPAGQVFERVMAAAGIARHSVFLANAVKAFRFEERGKRRIHQNPKASHISTCRPWLEAEIDLVRPRAILCLGGTAAQSVLGRSVRIGEERGRSSVHASGAEVRVTYHPSAVLRAPDPTVSAAIERALVEDLLEVSRYL